MDLHELKQRLQEHFTDGLVTIVGSGLSVAEGIPGMSGLATHLLKNAPSQLANGESHPGWSEIKRDLGAGVDLETVLLNHTPDETLESVIVNLTASLILHSEMAIIQEVISGTRTLRFSNLLNHMLKPNTGIPVITTNYDRLIEMAAEAVGLGVDSLFVGNYFSRLNASQSQASLCRGVTQRRKQVFRHYAEHIVLLKPHGSLDWFKHNGDPISCPLPLENQRLIITPGLNKFRGGYDRPFDSHRERANREIDKASRYLVIGYGFNDDHLQTHLEQQIRAGKPAVVLTHGLTSKARQLVSECDSILAVCADEGNPGAKVVTKYEEVFFPGPNFWDLDVFINEVLKP